VNSAEGKGSSFYIELPSDATAMETQTPSAQQPAVSGTNR